MLHQKNQDYLEFVDKMDESEILPRVTEVLQFLKQNNQYVVLGSASKNARPILEKVNILHYFDVIVDGNDVTNAKPDPEVFIQGANKVNVKYQHAIVFEDSVAGIQAANTAEMVSIGVGEKDVLHESDFCFKDFTEMSNDFLTQLINN
jgi:beta-phosphoglucomutase